MNNQTITKEKEGQEKVMTEKLYYNIPKRIIDIIGGIVGCIFTIPVIAIVKIAYMLDGDFAPVIFKQERIGRYGKPFKFYKFRSMVVNADEVLFKMLEEDEETAREYKRYKKLKNDPRITKVGKFIRKYSIDELPQFINVLKGDMSLVGPRPYLFREKEDMGEYFEIITRCKPGLSGYWQVNGRSHTDFGYRLVLDEYYYNHRNLILDIKIIIKTFVKVFKKDGAE